MKLLKTVILMSLYPLTIGVAPFLLVFGRDLYHNTAMVISGIVILSIGLGIPVLAMLITMAQDIYNSDGEGFDV